MNKQIYFLLILIGLLIGCRKEEINPPPVISLIEPYTNKHYNVFDTVFYKASAQDQNGVEYISASIVNDFLSVVTTTNTQQFNTLSAQVESYLVLDDIHLTSGTYYLMITASDGNNVTRSYTKISIIEEPLVLKNILIFSEQSSSQTEVYSLDSNLFVSKFTYPQGFQSAAINSYNQQIHILGTQGSMSTFTTDDYTEEWYINQINNPLQSFYGQVDVIDNTTFVSFGSGYIKGYDKFGVVRKSFNTQGIQYQPSIFYKWNYYLIAFEKAIGNQDNRIDVFYYGAGGKKISFYVDFDVVQFFYYREDKIMMWGNKNGKAKLYELSLLYNFIDEIKTLPLEQLFSAIQVEENIFLAAIGNDIYHFNSNTNSLNIYSAGVHADLLKFEELNSVFFIVNQNTLTVKAYPQNIELLTTTHNQPIKAIEFLYNK